MANVDKNPSLFQVDKLIFDFVNDSVYSTTDTTQTSGFEQFDNSNETETDSGLGNDPFAPLSTTKRASIIKVEKPVLLSVHHSIEISKHPAPTTMRPSTTTLTQSHQPSGPPRHNYHDKGKGSIPWSHFHYELPTLEESLTETSQLSSQSTSFGGVASNTVRPYNTSNPLTSTQEYEDYEQWLENEYQQVSSVLYIRVTKLLSIMVLYFGFGG